MNPKQTQLLVQYVFNLAKYDTNYDTRDKARLLRTLFFHSEKCPPVSRNAKKILLTPKPAPILESILRGQEQYTIGILSYVIVQKAASYQDLSDFPLEPPDPTKSCANAGIAAGGKKKNRTDEEFYSDEEEESEEEEEEEKPTDNINETDEYEQLDTLLPNIIDNQPESSEEESEEMKSFLGATSTSTPTIQQTNKTNALDDLNSLQSSPVNYYQQYDCFNRITGQGLQIQYHFSGTSFRRAPNMVHVELISTNTTTNRDIYSIKFLKSKSDVNIEGSNKIDILPSDATIISSIALFDISFDGDQLSSPLSILCHVGELIEQKFLSEQEFNQNLARLRVQTKILQCTNILSVPSNFGDLTIYRFSGQTILSESLILLTIQLNILQSIINLTINSDRIILATMLLNDIKQTLSIVNYFQFNY
ncbi:unnamed protein product [Rotaria sordida]|uniref:Uncharacterized protein n=1 Tax=Rotaria sordida TaxID=392033 RepID=A0A820A8A9_9BILA|nr:unnamed protein product [Rotaria sordida]